MEGRNAPNEVFQVIQQNYTITRQLDCINGQTFYFQVPGPNGNILKIYSACNKITLFHLTSITFNEYRASFSFHNIRSLYEKGMITGDIISEVSSFFAKIFSSKQQINNFQSLNLLLELFLLPILHFPLSFSHLFVSRFNIGLNGILHKNGYLDYYSSKSFIMILFTGYNLLQEEKDGLFINPSFHLLLFSFIYYSLWSLFIHYL